MPQTIYIPRKTSPTVRIDNADINIGDVGLLNTAGVDINPATEEKQDSIISSIGAISTYEIVGVKDSVDTRIDPSTEGKQDSIITELQNIEVKQRTLADYEVNDFDQATSKILYAGKSKPDGTWLIIVSDDTAETIRYANISNNGAQTTYALAWTNHLTLTYDEIHDLTF